MASDSLAQKLSVVIFLRHPIHGWRSFIPTEASHIDDGRCSSFPKIRKTIQNIFAADISCKPEFDAKFIGLLDIHCVNLHLTFEGNNCSSNATFCPRL